MHAQALRLRISHKFAGIASPTDNEGAMMTRSGTSRCRRATATSLAFLLVAARGLTSAADGDGRGGTVRGAAATATEDRRLRKVFLAPAWDEDQATCASRTAAQLQSWERGYDTRAACCQQLFAWSAEKRQLCEGGGGAAGGSGKTRAAPKARATGGGDEDGSDSENGSDSEDGKPIRVGCNESRGPCRNGRPANFRQKKRAEKRLQKSRRKKKDPAIKGGKRPERHPNLFT